MENYCLGTQVELIWPNDDKLANESQQLVLRGPQARSLSRSEISRKAILPCRCTHHSIPHVIPVQMMCVMAIALNCHDEKNNPKFVMSVFLHHGVVMSWNTDTTNFGLLFLIMTIECNGCDTHHSNRNHMTNRMMDKFAQLNWSFADFRTAQATHLGATQYWLLTFIGRFVTVWSN